MKVSARSSEKPGPSHGVFCLNCHVVTRCVRHGGTKYPTTRFPRATMSTAPPTTPGPHIVDGSLLERQKENIVPTRSGRSAQAISQLYSIPPAQRNKELAATHANFRARIDAMASEDDESEDDPVEPYWQYVVWIMDNYPSGMSKDSGLLYVLEEATRRFYEFGAFKNDKIYVRLWMEYANLIEQSERVYSFMLANDIGSEWPHVYEEYALVLERNRK